MKSSIEIIPGILTNNTYELAELIKKADGVVKRIHVDIIDGVYAENKTIDPSVMNNIDHSLLVDFHLMVNEPINWVEKCVRAGGDRIIGHVEMMTDVSEFILKVQEVGLYPGLAFDLDTPISQIESRLLKDLEVVLVMSVPAGFGGQKFSSAALEKIEELVEIRKEDETPFRICDDGGVDIGQMKELIAKGADQVVIGQRIFDGNLVENINEYEQSGYE